MLSLSLFEIIIQSFSLFSLLGYFLASTSSSRSNAFLKFALQIKGCSRGVKGTKWDQVGSSGVIWGQEGPKGVKRDQKGSSEVRLD